MKKIITSAILFLLVPGSVFPGVPTEKQTKTPIGFMENKGQFMDEKGQAVPQVLFKATGVGPGIYITTKGITYLFYERSKAKTNSEKEMAETLNLNWSKLEMHLEGASIKTENIKTENSLPGYSNFYYPNCPQGILNVNSWNKVTVSSVYPGIDWVLNADDAKGLSYDFIVHPGADPSQISVTYKGAASILVSEKNSRITLKSAYGELYEGGLNVFSEDGKKVKANFKIKGNEVSYSIGKYDKTQVLIIDPPLQWRKKQISTGLDYGYALAVTTDGTGDVLVTGVAGSLNFPTLNAYQGTNGGNEDMVIFRLNGNGTRLWSTYYGGINNDGGKGIATDATGSCYVTGYTNSTNFPVLNQIHTYGGATDAVVAKLDNTGVRVWSTFYGGLLNDYGNAITCDNAGNSYMTGYTNSQNFPVLNAVQGTKYGSNDAFVVKLNSASVAQWSTYFGGDDDDKGRAIALDASGANVFVTGSTTSGVFPTTTGVFQTSNTDAYNTEDAFILKMNTISTPAVQFATYCGGGNADFGQSIMADDIGNIYITGYTLSSNYPVKNPGNNAYVDSFIGSAATHDAYITKVNSLGTTVLWSTYLGGTAVDIGYSIVYNIAAGIFLTGSSASTDFPTQIPADNVYYQGTQGNGGLNENTFIAWFNSAGSMKWSTYYGDSTNSEGRGIGLDANGSIFIAGTDSTNISVSKFLSGLTTDIVSNNVTKNLLNTFPEPTSETLNFEVQVEKPGVLKIEIVNMEGQSIRKENLQSVPGKNVFSLNVSQLPVGMYFLKLEDAGTTKVAKFTKIK